MFVRNVAKISAAYRFAADGCGAGGCGSFDLAPGRCRRGEPGIVHLLLRHYPRAFPLPGVVRLPGAVRAQCQNGAPAGSGNPIPVRPSRMLWSGDSHRLHRRISRRRGGSGGTGGTGRHHPGGRETDAPFLRKRGSGLYHQCGGGGADGTAGLRFYAVRRPYCRGVDPGDCRSFPPRCRSGRNGGIGVRALRASSQDTAAVGSVRFCGIG